MTVLIARPVTGLGETTTTGTVPAVGTACVGNEGGINLNNTWSVTRTSTDEALSVVYGGTSVVIRP